MQTTILILLGLAIIACASTRSKGVAPPRSQHLKGWQKLFGTVAVILALLILLNPELLALGLLGDTALFDVLVLTLSLQMHSYAVRFLRRCTSVLSQGCRWLRIPSPGLTYLLAVGAAAMASVVSAFQKAQRLFS